jgi:hypothetical protein
MSVSEKPAEKKSATGRARALVKGAGLLILCLASGLAGGFIANDWATLTGKASGGLQQRVATLESGVAQLIVSQPDGADLEQKIQTLQKRSVATDAKVNALSKGQPISGQQADASASEATISARLNKLEKTVASLTDLPTKTATLDARLAETSTEIARAAESEKAALNAIGTRLDALEQAVPKKLDDRLTRLESQDTTTVLKHATALLALSDAMRTAQSGQSFTSELRALQAAAPDDAALAALQDYAATGVPAQTTLAARFPDAARAALDAERNAQPGGYFAKLWRNLTALARVRRVNDMGGTDNESRLARAQTALDKGKLDQAVQEVAAITGPAAGPLAEWLKDARARLVVESTLTRLSASLVEALNTKPTAQETAPGIRP